MMPARTASRPDCGISTIPALLAQCRMGILIPSSFSILLQKERKEESCASAWLLSASSALAKWVKIPSISSPGVSMHFLTKERPVSSGRIPIRFIPVSTLMWILKGRPLTAAACDSCGSISSLKTVGRISSLASFS